MEGQMSIFDFPEYLPEKHTRLVRSNEYEMHHCELCGTFVPCRVLKGKWPNQEYIVTRKCTGCNAIVDVDPEILKIESFFNKRKKEKDDVLSPAEEYYISTGKNDYWSRYGKSVDKFQQLLHEPWHDISEEPQEAQFCMFEYMWTMHQKEDSKGQCTGWWRHGKIEWLNMPFDIGKKRVIRWKPAEEPKPKEPKDVDIKGLCDDGYCPDCGVSLDDLTEECPECGCILNWDHWKILNEVD